MSDGSFIALPPASDALANRGESERRGFTRSLRFCAQRMAWDGIRQSVKPARPIVHRRRRMSRLRTSNISCSMEAGHRDVLRGNALRTRAAIPELSVPA